LAQVLELRPALAALELSHAWQQRCWVALTSGQMAATTAAVVRFWAAVVAACPVGLRVAVAATASGPHAPLAPLLAPALRWHPIALAARLRRLAGQTENSTPACAAAKVQLGQTCPSPDDLLPELCLQGGACNRSFVAMWANCSAEDYFQSPWSHEMVPMGEAKAEFRGLCSPCMERIFAISHHRRCMEAFSIPGGMCDRECYPMFRSVLETCAPDERPPTINATEWQTIRSDLQQGVESCPSPGSLTTFTTTSIRERRCVYIPESKALRLNAVPCNSEGA